MRNFILFSSILLSSILKLQAQDFTAMANIKLDTEEDYRNSEKELKQCLRYLTTTSLKDNEINRKYANQFPLRWLTGSPYVSLALKPIVLKLSKKNPEMMMIYMAGWASAALENPDLKSEEGNLAGIQQVYEYAKGDNGIKLDGTLKKLIKAGDAGGLEAWIAKQ
ncbi:MAG: hypothetical protein AB8H47_23775 [Bacteroidia bacterium]